MMCDLNAFCECTSVFCFEIIGKKIKLTFLHSSFKTIVSLVINYD